jgi:hypothetical protein
VAKSRKRPARAKPAPNAPGADAAPLTVLPHQLRAGDRVLDEPGHDWEIIGHPSAYRQGKMVAVKMQKPGDPSTRREHHWPAHERVPVRRGTGS